MTDTSKGTRLTAEEYEPFAEVLSHTEADMPHDFIDRSALTDSTPLADAPEATHPVAPDGPIPSLEEIEAEQSE